MSSWYVLTKLEKNETLGSNDKLRPPCSRYEQIKR